MPTENQVKLSKLQKLSRIGSVPIYEEISALEDKDTELETEIDTLAGKQNMLQDIPMKIDDLSQTLAEVHQAVTHKEDTGEIIIKIDPAKIMGKPGLKPIAGVDYPIPKDGKDYILTEEDKRDIAQKIKVPIVEKVVEKTEVIKEHPIITNEIKEVAILETPEAIRDKLQTLEGEERLDAQYIKNLPEVTQQIGTRSGWGAHPLMIKDDGVVIDKVARTLNFTGGTVTRSPDGTINVAQGTVATLDGSGATNELAYWVDSDTLGTLAVATYPSLTELSYLKGVTSALQTQLGNKQPLDAQLTDIAGLAVTDGNIIVGDGANWVAESGATARTSLGLGAGNSPQFTAIELNHATDTTLSRVSAGVVAIEGVNILTTAGGTLTGNITLGENTSIALDPAGSADGKYSGITVAGTAGEALVFGDVLVLDVTAGKWFKGSVSAAAGADGDLRGGTGMCVLAAAGDASATTVLLHGTCRADTNFPALTVGSVVYATTLGDITVTQPTTTDHVIKVLGYALTADEVYFNPSPDYITHT